VTRAHYPGPVKIVRQEVRATILAASGTLTGGFDEGPVRSAAEDLLRIARESGVDGSRLLAQRMADADTELIAGLKHDPHFGPAAARKGETHVTFAAVTFRRAALS
jgi:acyl-CoA synthetase (NDP forming)